MSKGYSKRIFSVLVMIALVFQVVMTNAVSAIEIQPDMPQSTSTAATFDVNGTIYNDLNTAITAAASSNASKITLAESGYVSSGNYTIPSGITLLIPYDNAYTVVTNSNITSSSMYTTDTTATYFRTLELLNGAVITVNGALSVASKINRDSKGQAGPCGRIVLNENAKIVLNSESNLYAFGYISGNGLVEAKSDSNVYESMFIADYPGSASNLMKLASTNKVFPFSKFTIRNIEASLKIYNGAKEEVLANLYGTNFLVGYRTIWIKLIGNSNQYFFQTSGYIIKSYKNGRQIVEICGNSTINSISITLYITINTSNMSGVPIPFNFDIIVSSGALTLGDNVILSKGSTATISQGSSVIIPNGKKLVVLDGSDDKQAVGTQPDAVLNINGDVNINGALLTSVSGASIKSSNGTGRITFNSGAVSDTTVKVKSSSTTAADIAVTQAKLQNGDGSYTETAGSAAGTTFSYCAAHDKWEKDSATHVKVEFETNGGNQIDAQIIDKGTKATRPSDPEKAGYTFAGWFSDEDLTNEFDFNTSINENVKLYANWNIPSYTVTWVDEDGTVLETDENVPVGTIPTFDGETPSKEATAQYTYTFNGWSPAIGPVEGDQVYTATYKETVRKYRIVFWNEDGSEEFYNGDYAYGVTPVCNGTPSKSPTAGYTYEFAGWASEAGGDVIDPLPTVEGDASYYAVFTATPIEYTVKWSINGEIQEETYTYNEVPEYKGSEPVKEADNTYRYTFAGWSKSSNGAVLDALDPVTKNVTYYAVFTKEKIEYTVVFVNHDGTELQSGTYSYNDQVYYVEPEPQRDGDAQYSYTFTGWSDGSNFYSKDGDLPRVTANTTYTAQFESTLKKYTVTWIGADGNTLKTEEIEYGTMPVYTGEEPAKQSDWQYDYVFDGWDPEIVSVTGDARYTAKFKAVLRGNIVFGVRPVLDGILSLKFYIVPAESAKAAKLTYTYTYGSEEITKVEEFDLTDGSLFDNSTGCVVLRYTNIQSGCIARDVVLTIYDENGEEQEILSRLDQTFRDTSYSYCVADWSRSIIAQYGDDESKKNTVELAKAIINYGYYSAEYFKLRFDGDYTNAESGFYGDLTESDISVLNAHAGIKDANSADVGLLGCRVILEGATTLRVYFKNPVESATVDGQACEVIPKDNMYYAELVNIASPNLDKTHTFKVSYNGSEYTFEYSVLSWVNSMISSSSTKQETYDLAKAIYLYWKAANAYFAQ